MHDKLRTIAQAIKNFGFRIDLCHQIDIHREIEPGNQEIDGRKNPHSIGIFESVYEIF